MSHEPTLVLLPGLGCDARMFAPQQSLPVARTVIEWIEPQPRETLAGYARRMAERLDVPSPFFLGGVSMGGMVALEMSRWTRPEAVLLVASARSGRAVRPLWQVLGRLAGAIPFWGHIPPRASRVFGWIVANWLVTVGERLTAEQRRLCAEIAAAASPRFVRWGCRAVVTWPGADSPRAPVYQIHGDRDGTIPLRRVQPDRIVRGGGHLINLTHADEVNAYLIERIESHPAQ